MRNRLITLKTRIYQKTGIFKIKPEATKQLRTCNLKIIQLCITTFSHLVRMVTSSDKSDKNHPESLIKPSRKSTITPISLLLSKKSEHNFVLT